MIARPIKKLQHKKKCGDSGKGIILGTRLILWALVKIQYRALFHIHLMMCTDLALIKILNIRKIKIKRKKKS